MPKRFINPEGLARPNGYSHLVESTGGRTVYISGQIAIDAQGQLVGGDDIATQTEQVFKNLQAALMTVGGDFGDVVKLTFYIADMSQMQAVRNVRDRYIDLERPPASSAIEVKQLVRPEWLIEIDAIAVIE